ncbi:MAG: hypothetical protein MZV64_40765 [Ignavibacteriales bacterium]|nr:hypothetical protein [Ignavibacteriales bacterium]
MMNKIIFIVISFSIFIQAQTKYSDINEQISQGNYSQAQTLIENKLFDKNLSELEKYDLKFQIELMDRIRKDFKLTRDQVISSLKKYYPNLSDEMLLNWEKDNSLEMKMIDGEKKYFNNAVPNLFRINKEAKKIEGKARRSKTGRSSMCFWKTTFPKFLKLLLIVRKRYVLPVKMKIKYSLTVKPNVVPEGEIIRCWLPYPRESNPRQTDIQLLKCK